MKRTDKEITEAMTFIKEQHNGEIPYQFGAFECAKMMAKYLKNQLTIHVLSVPKGTLCDVCGSDDLIEAPSMGRNCNSCNPL